MNQEELLEIKLEMYQLMKNGLFINCLMFRQYHQAKSELAILRDENVELNKEILEIVNDKLVGNLISEEMVGVI